MRYIIDTKDEQGLIGIQIEKWRKDQKLDLIEKADPVVEIKDKLERVSRALETLKKAGWNKEVMEIYICRKAKVGIITIQAVMESQEQFFKAIGVRV